MADTQGPGVKAEKKAGMLTVAKTVFWSFLGIRKRAEHEADAVRISPKQVIIAGLIGAALFITTLLLLVRFVISMVAA
jgi:preprotein translocase subunit Sec61beta